MDRKQRTYVMAGFGALVMIVVLLLAQRSLSGRGEQIVLPDLSTGTEDGPHAGQESGGLNEVRITPDTVQLAIGTLSRPTAYSRTQSVEVFWSGGSGVTDCTVSVSGGITRVDTRQPDGSIRHTLVAGNQAAVWYDDEEAYTVLSAQGFSGDIAARMPTYETVLSLPVEEIVQADYRERDGVACIYVATRETEGGYADQYWISTATGLLQAAERTEAGQLVYRFTAGEAAQEPPEETLFQLPDGSPWPRPAETASTLPAGTATTS